jgi:hypothetical protein
VGAQFLGVDISLCFWHSLLDRGLDFSKDKGVARLAEPTREASERLLRLVSAYFGPALNGNGLFGDYRMAEFCNATLRSIQVLVPALFEGGAEWAFETVGLHAVDVA